MRISNRLLFVTAVAAVLSISLGLHAALHLPLQQSTVNIPYQGFLQQNGSPLTTGGAGIPIAVMLYDGDATNPFFTDSFSAVQVNSGHFSVVLGQSPANPLHAELFNGTPINIGGTPVTVVGPIKVGVSIGGSGSPLSGRQTLFPAPYAQVANYANQSADTFSVGTNLTVNNNLSAASASVSGNVSAASASVSGKTTTTSLDVTAFDQCPPNYDMVVLKHSILCVHLLLGIGATYLGASDQCDLDAGARLCTYQQARRYCLFSRTKSPPSFLTAGSLLADRAGDDIAIEVNNDQNCDNFDGTVGGFNTITPNAYCCLEWTKYQ